MQFSSFLIAFLIAIIDFTRIFGVNQSNFNSWGKICYNLAEYKNEINVFLGDGDVCGYFMFDYLAICFVKPHLKVILQLLSPPPYMYVMNEQH